MKKVLKLFWAVLFVAVVITVTQYQTFTALVSGEWAFITDVFANLSTWTNYLNTIAFVKYAIVAASLLIVIFTLIIKFIKKLFKKKVKKNKSKLPVRSVQSTTVSAAQAPTSSTKKFTRV